MFEQLSIFEETTNNSLKNGISYNVKCKFEKPLRRYFCEDNWYSTECKGCPNYKEDNRLELWGINDDTDTKYLSYLDFKTWLYENYPIFIDKEEETDVWKIQKGTGNINVRIATYNKLNDDNTENHDQFISVSYMESTSGWSHPCDTLQEVRFSIDRALNYERS